MADEYKDPVNEAKLETVVEQVIDNESDEHHHHHDHERHEKIAVAAYFIWMNNGAIANDPNTLANWMEAEKEEEK